MISNIMIFSIIGIVIAVMAIVVILYWRKINREDKKEQDREEQDVNNEKSVEEQNAKDEGSDEGNEIISVIEKIVYEAIPALNEKISKIEADISMLKNAVNMEERPKEEEIAVNIIGIKTEKGIELIFLSEDIKVPKRLISNEQKIEKEKKELSNEELENKIIEAIKNGNTTFKSIAHAINQDADIKLGNLLKKMIESGKVIKNEDKSYSVTLK